MKKTILIIGFILSSFILKAQNEDSLVNWLAESPGGPQHRQWNISHNYAIAPTTWILKFQVTPTKIALKSDTIDLNGTFITPQRLAATQAVVLKSQAFDSTDIVHFKSAFSWGNHSGLYKLVSYVPSWSEITSKPTFFSGDYNDLVNRPTLFDGDYGSLTNKPNLFSGAYSDLTGKPSLFSGSYTDLTNKPKIPVPYSGTSNASGVYTVTFAQAYSVAPNIQANIVNQSATNQFIRITSISTTGFTVNVFQRNSINLLGTDVLLFSTANVSGASVDVLITEK
jgi:hypothetical protein